MSDSPAPRGRPPVGPAFTIRFPEDLLERIDDAAAERGMSRADWLRAVAKDALQHRSKQA